MASSAMAMMVMSAMPPIASQSGSTPVVRVTCVGVLVCDVVVVCFELLEEPCAGWPCCCVVLVVLLESDCANAGMAKASTKTEIVSQSLIFYASLISRL